MWFEKIQSKKGIRFKYSERFQGDNGKVTKVSLTFPKKATKRTEREYRDALYKKYLQKKTDQQQLNPASSIKTFYDLLDVWESLSARNIKYGTHKLHQNIVRKVKRLCADVPLSALSPRLIQNALDTCYHEQQLSFSYTSNIQAFIKQALQYAHKEHLIADIAGFMQIHLKKDREREQRKEMKAAQNKFLNHDELKAALQQLHAINDNVALAMEFVSLTGLRIGELLALRNMDYDRENHLIHVNATLSAYKKAGEDGQRGTPKNIYSYRDVWLNTRAREILDTMIARYRAYLWRKGKMDNRQPEDQYIFCTRNGYAWRANNIRKIINKAIHIPGKHVTPHIFRHTHISWLVEQGVPLKAIMQRVGHHDPQTTLKIYTHVTDRMTDKERQVIEGLSV